MLTQHDFGLRKAFEQPIIDHRLGATRRFLRRLEHRHDRTTPSLAGAREQRGRSNQPRYMHVVTAGVHDRYRLPFPIGSLDLASVGHAGRLLDRQGVHVGTEHHGRPSAVAQKPHHPGVPDSGRHLIASRTQPLRRKTRCSRFLHGELGMSM
jgi:hypothetical protein